MHVKRRPEDRPTFISIPVGRPLGRQMRRCWANACEASA